MMDLIKKGMDANEALKKATAHYGDLLPSKAQLRLLIPESIKREVY